MSDCIIMFGVTFAENQDNLYLISKYFEHRSVFLLKFNKYYHTLCSLHILIYIGIMKFIYIYTVFLEYSHVSYTNLFFFILACYATIYKVIVIINFFSYPAWCLIIAQIVSYCKRWRYAHLYVDPPAPDNANYQFPLSTQHGYRLWPLKLVEHATGQ